MARKFQDRTAADKKEVGFHFQHYYALLQLLKLDPHESLSVEEKDDIVITTSQGLRLLQLKHTLQVKKDGSSKNLTSKDYSLWHTIDNWIKLISDENDGRAETLDQIKFINATKFGLVTNKSNGDDNEFLVNLEKIVSGEIEIEVFKNEIRKLIKPKKVVKSKKAKEESDDDTISNKYINDFLEFEHIESLIKNIDVTLNEDNLINKIKEYLKVNLAVDNFEDAYYEIEGRLRTLNYLSIKDNKKITYSKIDFSKNILAPVLEKVRNSKFYITKEAYVENPKIEDANFAKQLLDLQVRPEDVIDVYYYMQICLSNLKKWEERDNIIQPEDREKYFKNAIRRWKHYHDVRHRQPHADENNSLDCYSDCMLETLKLCSVEMDEDVSNGTFIYLSDDLKIGWLKNWELKYGKK